jgi:predicted nucleic acid-binding protein
MKCQSCLLDPLRTIVADTSVVINLDATGYCEKILDTLPNRFLIVDQVLQEFEDGLPYKGGDESKLSALIASGRVEVVGLGDVGMERFSDLVAGAAAETLDDGESATIAYALEQQDVVAVLDERKANKICADRFASLPICCTVDFFLHDRVQEKMGPENLTKAVFNTLYYGRMRVLPHHVDWVLGLIGRKRATKCMSLPKSARLNETFSRG